MAVNLTTRSLYKTFASVQGSAQDDLIDQLIDEVSEAIAQHCTRTFEATDYKKWLDGTGTNRILLPDYPITNLYGVSLGTVNVGEVTFSGGTWSSFSIIGTTVQLDSIASDATVSNDTTTLTGTITDLAAVIDALTGWSVTVEAAESTQAAILIRPVQGVWCLSPDTADLDIPDELIPARLMEGSEQSIQTTQGRCFPMGTSNVFTWFKAGYTLPVDNAQGSALTTVGNVPKDLTLITNSIIKLSIDWADQEIGGMESEKFSRYSYKIRQGGAAIIQQGIKDHSEVLINHVNVGVV